MASNFYLVPLLSETVPKSQTRPKYFGAPGTQADIVLVGNTGTTWGGNYLGNDAYIVWADTSPAQDAALVAQSDVTKMPPLDNTVTAGALNTVQTQMEAIGIPSQWVQVGMSYRTILRVVLGMVKLLKQMASILGGQRIALTGNLNRTFDSFSANIQNAFMTACAQQSIDTSGIVGTTTLREMLRLVGQQFTQTVFTIGQGVI